MKLMVTVFLVIICIVIISSAVLLQNPFLQILSTIISGIFGIILQSLAEVLNTQKQGFKLWFQSQIQFRNTSIRLSFSYLFKIKIDGKYLLIKGEFLPNQYQPIGGVYKYFFTAKDYLNKIHFIPDTQIGNEEETDDLRIRIKGKYLLSFFRWFNSQKDREISLERELYEELFNNGLVDKNAFGSEKISKVGIHNKGITWSQPFNTYEYVYADIVELILTPEQEHLIKEAVKNNPSVLCLASEEQIKCRRYNNPAINIGNNAEWLLEPK